jgi:hypothetical protein
VFQGTGARRALAVCRCSIVIAIAMLAWCAAGASARQLKVVSAFAQSRAYRHGVVPMLGRLVSRSGSVGGGNLSYQGGVGGAGVVTGAPHVYLVFWGSQWGQQRTDSRGDVTLSGDSAGMAPDLQEFMKGLGTVGESWSGVMTQYCQGVSTGAQACPAGAAHVSYPTGGVLAGVWVDESTFAPLWATGHQLGQEAMSASAHFGNTSETSDRNVQYVIISPTGTHPDGFNTPISKFCAWHDSTGDLSLTGGPVSSPYGQVQFTNLPYVTDAGASCGQGFVNPGAGGALDGVTIVEGHEYAETLTDPYPSSGWIDGSGNEDGDKCAWIKSGAGASQNVTLGTGSFAVQSTWANDANGGSGGCEVSHPTVGS